MVQKDQLNQSQKIQRPKKMENMKEQDTSGKSGCGC